MPASDIVIKGAREHNLRDISLVLPRNQLICLTGVSGSGKSSLAFDTLFAEGQRRYIESLSSFARQFLQQLPKPDVDLISGISPSISISQKSTGNNPRSTVGTITEINDYLRVLYARVGQGHCPRCGAPIAAQTRDQITAGIRQLPPGTKFLVLAPVVRNQKGEHRDLFSDLLKQGFLRVRVDGEVRSLSESFRLERQIRHNIEVVIDRLEAKAEYSSRLAEAVDLALKVGGGTMWVVTEGGQPTATGHRENDAAPVNQWTFSSRYACAPCGLSFDSPTPQMFSFNSPAGMCSACAGLGRVFSFVPQRLIPDERKSIKQGCFEVLGKWADLGRWRRHIYQGVADTIERLWKLDEGVLLETPWGDLAAEHQQLWLYGTGDQHITFTWRGGSSPMKYGGTFAGIISELDERYRNLKAEFKRASLEQYMDHVPCAACRGARLNDVSRHYRLTTVSAEFDQRSLSLPEVSDLSIERAATFFSGLELDATGQIVADQLLKEVQQRLGFLINVGLSYLTLSRTAPTLSGGETQRIRLAGQIGAGLIGVLYILDEPSIGLHSRDNDRLIATLQRLRDLGNTVVVVEHDEETMRAADHLIDFGPGPGIHGGQIVVSGTPEDIMHAPRSVTGQYLSGRRQIAIPARRRKADPQRALRIIGARQNNLQNITVEIPLGLLVCVTGVSGSGKSSLVNDILIQSLQAKLNRGLSEPAEFDRLEGVEHLDKMIAIDQSPIGRTPRSNPGTYIKLFDDIRALYAQLPEAKKRGFAPGRFSFNVPGGRCEACEGNGANKLEMDFLADIWVTCPVCQGARFNRETQAVRFREKSIDQVLQMTIAEALPFFENIPKIHDKLRTLHDVGLDYLQIGQPSPTLSGGEAQRIKLARELVKRSTGRTLYLLDEPTTGLHFADIELLLRVLHRFADAGNTVVVVEHNLDVIKTADWVIDLGPEGGAAGGRVVCAGTPEDVAACSDSHTGRALAKVLSPRQPPPKSARRRRLPSKKAPHSETEIVVQGARQHNLKNVHTVIPRDQLNVFCGPSGSGKSSLAMDTIYAEGQRRYVESLSSYARQFVNQMDKPKVDHIDGLSPAIAIEQKNFGSTPRSTVGTITEIYDYLRVLFARLGTPYCPQCDVPIGTQTPEQIADKMVARFAGQRVILLAPLAMESTSELDTLGESLRSQGYVRVRVNGRLYAVDELPPLNRLGRHEIEVVMDRLDVKPDGLSRIRGSVEAALSLGQGRAAIVAPQDAVAQEHWPLVWFSQHLACETCGRGFERLNPHHFSFNSQLGWCPECQGLGTQTGTSPALLFKNLESTLAMGGIRLWPNLADELSRSMLAALCRSAGIPLDVPISQLDARQRRVLFYGTGERWIEVALDGGGQFAFQFKGLYPAIEEAANLSVSLRNRLSAFVGEVDCGACGGSRLREDAAAFRFESVTLDGLCRLPLGRLLDAIERWKLDERAQKIAGELIGEIRNRVRFLVDVGLEYLTLARGSATLSNGESQRIRLASQLGSGLCGVLYVLDEPTIGLHPRDNQRLLGALKRLRDLGNTLIVVEHDREVVQQADCVFDFGPGAGRDGGEVVAFGKPARVARDVRSVTGAYLSGKRAIPIPSNRRPGLMHESDEIRVSSGQRPRKRSAKESMPPRQTSAPAETLRVSGARHNNLQNISVEFPLHTLTVVTGPSGCGKSSLVNDILYAALARRLHGASVQPGAHQKIEGLEFVNKVIQVDQQPLGTTPASNPATYTGAFELIRNLFAELPDAKVRGFSARQFSFNVAGGRCEACQGIGQRCIEMHFLPDVWVPCEVCQGQRYTQETLAVQFHGQSIHDVLEMTCRDALQLFQNVPKIRKIIQTLCDVGLDYVRLGQSAPTLSGGEAQRVKLAAELARPDTGRTVYILDEPSTGLHFDDLAKLLDVLQRLVDLGNTVIVIEHNLDLIKCADWVIDLGPEAGAEGGQVVVAGTPETIADYARRAARPRGKLLRSWTGEALAPVLAAGPYQKRAVAQLESVDPEDTVGEDPSLAAAAAMPWESDGRRWHTEQCVGYNGKRVQWDGRILAAVVDRIEAYEGFEPTNWNQRNVVEIAAPAAGAGWFLHAITGDQWWLKLKFRVRRGTFRLAELAQRIPLKTANDMDDLPVYGNEPRLRVSQRGPWQEIEWRLHAWEEIDTPEFWEFINGAIVAYLKPRRDGKSLSIKDEMPWMKLGKKWHLLPKGFLTGGAPQWRLELIEVAQQMLSAIAPECRLDWKHKQFVHVSLPGSSRPWATLQTKKPEMLWLHLRGPRDRFPLGRLTELGAAREVAVHDQSTDTISLGFSRREQLEDARLSEFLAEHALACSSQPQT